MSLVDARDGGQASGMDGLVDTFRARVGALDARLRLGASCDGVPRRRRPGRGHVRGRRPGARRRADRRRPARQRLAVATDTSVTTTKESIPCHRSPPAPPRNPAEHTLPVVRNPGDPRHRRLTAFLPGGARSRGGPAVAHGPVHAPGRRSRLHSGRDTATQRRHAVVVPQRRGRRIGRGCARILRLVARGQGRVRNQEHN